MVDENKFWDLVRKWSYDTRFTSSASDILNHNAISSMIRMGSEVIPLILQAMEESSHLTFVLYKLTGDWPVANKHKGNQAEIVKAWRQWAKKKGY